ncbi:MAG: tyrosine/phenylalanine carboxypeptidase domain-containing protein [Cyclobacteriaceae bacterium]
MQESIKNSVKEYLENETNISINLENGGKLKKERLLPYILVYRYANRNDRNIRLVLGESSYIIFPETERPIGETAQLIKFISKFISEKVGAVMLIELWIGEEGITDFTVFAPKDKVPNTINSLTEGLEDYVKRHLGLGVKVKYSLKRNARWTEPLLSMDQCQEAGILLLGLEIPPFYLDRNKNEFYFLEFRDFKIALSKILRKCIFNFIRTHTTLGIKHYYALGSTSINPEILNLDRQLSEFEKKYRFLLLISPTNTMEAKAEFKANQFQYSPKFIYRLLPIDPEQIKEDLYQLDLRSIEDPTLSLLFNAKREEIEKQVTMLKERGTKNFMFSSIRLYSSVDGDLYGKAKNILELVSPEIKSGGELADCYYLAHKCREEIDYYRQFLPQIDPTIEIKSDMVGMLVSQGQLFIGESYKVPKNRVEALVHHEVGTHVLTYYNGMVQPFRQMCTGFAGYEELQEGLAVLSEFLVGGLTADRMRLLAGRVVAAHCLTNDFDFPKTFKLLTDTYLFGEEPAFEITARIFQGGGCTKDIIYLRGLISLIKYLYEDGDLSLLYIGKIALDHVPLIKELQFRKILKPQPLVPRYMTQKNAVERLDRVRKGITLLEMIN